MFQIWTWSQLLVLMSIFASFVAIALLGFHVQSTRQVFVGVVAVIVTIAVHASPLTIIRMVIKTKSVEFMPFYPSLGYLVCGLIWGGK